MSTNFSSSNTPQYPASVAIHIHSVHLHRSVAVSLILPAEHKNPGQKLPLVIFQDGQDFPALQLRETVGKMMADGKIPPVIIAGVHANEKRIYEYGVAAQPDYKGRGHLAGAHTRFVVDELLPHLNSHYPLNADRHAIAGFSLGGLMALDIAWNHPELFSRTGCFSGSLWWRQKAFDLDYDNSDRIMHRQIRTSSRKPDLKFWFQTGSRDEDCDRNNDGVIDSIEDTLDCIAELERKGYRWKKDVLYREVENGEHNPHTWQRIMPEFLSWALKK